MFKHRLDSSIDRKVIFHWCLLSFNGGCINAGGFLATGRFVSHVTGFATLFGVDIVKNQIGSALGLLSVPFFFLIGAFLAGLLIDRPVSRGRKPHFDLVMGLSACCLMVAAIGGELEKFGNFGGVFHLKQGYTLLSLLCLACGLQNGAITSSSAGTFRTTHLTGLTTDLGLGFARLLNVSANDERFRTEARVNWLRSGAIASFILGSASGAWLFAELGFRGFFAPALISMYATYQGYRSNLSQS